MTSPQPRGTQFHHLDNNGERYEEDNNKLRIKTKNQLPSNDK